MTLPFPITVLEELDRFKKGNEDINFQARAFLRRLDELTGDVLSSDGTSLGPGLGRCESSSKPQPAAAQRSVS
jgi:PhoH-like ATPase